jgi:hypothetical protein
MHAKLGFLKVSFLLMLLSSTLIFGICGCGIKQAVKLEPSFPPELQSLDKIGKDTLEGDWLGRYHAYIDGRLCADLAILKSSNGGKCSDGTTPPTHGSAEKMEYRDRILDAIRAKMDISYHDYISSLHVGRAYFNIAGDFASLGLTSAASVIGDAGTKEILAIAATGSTGARSSVTKELFDEQSRQAIISTMDADRSGIQLRIEQSQKGDVTLYSLEKGLIDLQSYFSAGSIVHALQTIQGQAGATKSDNTQHLNDLRNKTIHQN